MRRLLMVAVATTLALSAVLLPTAPTSALVARTVFADGFEFGLGDWVTDHTGAGTAPDWRRVGTGQFAGSFAAQVPGAATVSSQTLTTGALSLGEEPTLSFRHRWSLELSGGVRFDGGVVEYSTDGGTSWNDLKTIAPALAYNGTVTNTTENPIGGRQAFTGTQNTYQLVSLSLPSLANQTVRVRFHLGADEAVSSGGWWVDDVVVADQAAAPIPPVAAPTGVQATPTSSTRVAVTFTPAGGSPVRPVVAHEATCTGLEDGIVATAVTRQHEVEVDGLTPGSEYQCAVRAWTTSGYGVTSAPVGVSTPASFAPDTRQASPRGQRDRVQPGTVVQRDDRYDVPTVLWASEPGRVAAPRRGQRPAVAAARGHLTRLAEAYRLPADDVADARVTGVHDLGRGAVIVRFGQSVGGVEIWQERLNLVMRRDLGLVGATGFLLPRRVRQPAFPLAADRIVAAAYRALTGRAARGLVADGTRAGYRWFTGPDDFVDPSRARRVMFRTPGGLVAAWYVELFVDRGGQTSSLAYVVAADDGRVIQRVDLSADDNPDYDYRVWADQSQGGRPYDGPQGTAGSPHPTGVPDGFAASFIAPSLVQGPLTGVDPWLGVGATTTSGNNVDAYADLVEPDGFSAGDIRADVTSPGVFDRTYDTTQSPGSTTQTKAAVTQLFYTVNYLHDWFYASGFDEAAGNAQQDNFGRGGVGGDPIHAEHDVSDTDNAIMSTPADGLSPVMQMYPWTGPVARGVEVTDLGSFAAGSAEFGPASFDLTDDVVASVDATGTTTDGCEAPTNDISGKIALVDHGSACSAVQRAQVAQAAGAVGLLIANNTGGFPTLPGLCGGCTVPLLGLTPADGAALRTAIVGGSTTARMFRQGTTPNRPAALDTTVVAHEWGHYLVHRLVGVPADTQAQAMGEGWGDFVALLTMVRAEDVAHLDGAFAIAGYAAAGFSNSPHYFGVRRVPYSTDFTRNALTFRHISDDQALPAVPTDVLVAQNSEVHNAGEIWATMLWECYAALLGETTGESPRLTFAQARRRMSDYLVESLMLTPVNPTFLEARDALLEAAWANDPEDYELFAAAFARRGAGADAVGPARTSSNLNGITESYAVDIAPPVTSAQAVGGTVGDNGWFTTPPRISVSATDSGKVTELRCVLDDPTHAGFAQLPAVERDRCDEEAPGATAPEGVHTVYAASMDLGGRVSAVVSTRVKVDSQPPDVDCISASLPVGVPAQVHATVTDPTSGPVQADVSAAADTSTAGERSVQVEGQDRAGNTTSVSCPYTVFEDLAAPSVTSLSSQPAEFVSGTVTVTATATDQPPGSVGSVVFTVDDGSIVEPVEDQTAPYSFALDSTLLQDGAHSVEAVAFDTAGNDSVPEQLELTVDNTVPTTPTMQAPAAFTTKASVNLAFSATDDGSGVDTYALEMRQAAYSANNLPTSWSPVTGAQALATGSFQVTGLARGRTYCFRALATDQAGNQSVASPARCTARLLDDPSLTRSKGWKTVKAKGYYGGSATRTTLKGKKLTLANFHGKRLALRVSTCSSCGSVNVFVGTSLVKTVSLVSSKARTGVLVTIVLPSRKTGTVKIVTRSAKSVTIDGLGVSHT